MPMVHQWRLGAKIKINGCRLALSPDRSRVVILDEADVEAELPDGTFKTIGRKPKGEVGDGVG